MIVWKYRIYGDAGTIITRDPDFAEMKSRLGNIVFCKRESNIFSYNN